MNKKNIRSFIEELDCLGVTAMCAEEFEHLSDVGLSNYDEAVALFKMDNNEPCYSLSCFFAGCCELEEARLHQHTYIKARDYCKGEYVDGESVLENDTYCLVLLFV